MTVVNTGTAPNAGNGDPLREAMLKINQRFLQVEGLQFLDAKYLGVNETDPTQRIDETPLVSGDFYLHESTNQLRFFSGAVWGLPTALEAVEQVLQEAKVARDSALLNAGKYPSADAALSDNSLPDLSYFLVQGAGDTAAYEYRKIQSPNLFNTATVRAGFLINSGSGVINSLAGWGCSAFIPVTAGLQYTISGTRGRYGLAFFTSASDTAVVSGSYNGTTTLPLTVTAPVGATHIVINLYSDTAPTYSNVQVEAGSSATSHVAFGVQSAAPVTQYPSVSFVESVKSRVESLEDAPFIIKTPSVNLLNTALVQGGKLVNSATGVLNDLEGWGCSGFIPVTAGLQYTISGTRGRHGLAFFTEASGAAVVSGSYNGTVTLPLTVTAPVGATHLVINLYSSSSPTYSDVQVEQASSATPFLAYGTTRQQLDRDYLFPEDGDTVFATGTATLSLTTTGDSYIQAWHNGKAFRTKVIPFSSASNSASEVFNFSSDAYDGTIFKTSGDDVAPYRAFGTTIGANHGYAKTHCNVEAHGKTFVDVGSIWTDGSVQWVICDIPDVNTIAITSRASNSSFVSGTLTHVSGAEHSASFSPIGVTQGQWYPVIKNRNLTISVDGIIVTDNNRDYAYTDNATFAESYDVMNKSSIVEWLITQVGTSTPITSYSGVVDLSVSMIYVFDSYGACVIHSDFLAINAVSEFFNIMFTQMFTFIPGVDGPVKYYVPKSLPFTQDSTAYDFTVPRDMTGFSIPTRLDFTPDRTLSTGLLADRAVMLNNSVGMAVGYVPVLSADPSVRRTNASTKALQISELAKVYMSCIDSTSNTSLAAGDYYSAITYRVPFVRTSARTCSYVVRTPLGCYLYCDWHSDVIDRVQLPPDLHGAPFSVVEKSSNVAVLSASATSSIVFNVTASGDYGYAILKFAR